MREKLFISHFIKRNGKVIFKSPKDLTLFNELCEGLREGQVIDVMIDFSSDNGSLGQIAKLKAGIRKIADETGETFINAQNEVKKQSGLYDELSKEYKSFGNCSKEELSSAIQIMIEIGKFINVDLS